jgi:addiction module RelE/StbE family toxin
MEVIFHKNFKKQYKKLRSGERIKCEERIAIFVKNPHHSVLDNHSLGGKYKKYKSINISGDLRAIYELVAKNTALFILVDTHSNLYS